MLPYNAALYSGVTMALFRPTPVIHLEKCEAALAANAEQLAEAEARLAAMSLGSVVADDAEADSVAAEVAALRLRREVLESALVKAQAAERDRLAAIREKEDRARVKRFRRHLSDLERAGRDFEGAVAAMIRCWEKMQAAAGEARAMLPPQHALHTFTRLFDRPLRLLAEAEIARQGRGGDPLRHTEDAPGAGAAALDTGTVPATLPPLGEALAGWADHYVETFEELLGLFPELPPVAAAAPDPAEPTPEAAGSGAAAASVSRANPHPVGSVEHAEFEAAMAEIHGRRVAAA